MAIQASTEYAKAATPSRGIRYDATLRKQNVRKGHMDYETQCFGGEYNATAKDMVFEKLPSALFFAGLPFLFVFLIQECGFCCSGGRILRVGCEPFWLPYIRCLSVFIMQ